MYILRYTDALKMSHGRRPTASMLPAAELAILNTAFSSNTTSKSNNSTIVTAPLIVDIKSITLDEPPEDSSAQETMELVF